MRVGVTTAVEDAASASNAAASTTGPGVEGVAASMPKPLLSDALPEELSESASSNSSGASSTLWPE